MFALIATPPPIFTLNYLLYVFSNKHSEAECALIFFFSFKSSSGLLTCISSFKAPSAPPSGSQLPGNPPQWPSGGSSYGGSSRSSNNKELSSYPLGSHSIFTPVFVKGRQSPQSHHHAPGMRGAISKRRVSESPSPVLSMIRTIASLNLM